VLTLPSFRQSVDRLSLRNSSDARSCICGEQKRQWYRFLFASYTLSSIVPFVAFRIVFVCSSLKQIEGNVRAQACRTGAKIPRRRNLMKRQTFKIRANVFGVQL
jgi:hypothetical protein